MKLRAGAFALVAMTAMPVLAQDASTVVATVNGTDITLGHMAAMREQLPPQWQSAPDDMVFKTILEQMIRQVALSKSAEGLVTKKDELSMENDRSAALASIVIEDALRTQVTEEALRKLYDERFAKAEPATEYNAAHILVATEDEAKAIRADLDKGGDFAEQARAHSTDGSAQGGGVLGWFKPEQMVKPFGDAVVAMKVGEIAGPVQTQFGWHLIKLDETRAATAPSFEEVADELGRELEQQVVEARIAAAEQAAEITRKDEGLDPAILKSETLFGK